MVKAPTDDSGTRSSQYLLGGPYAADERLSDGVKLKANGAGGGSEIRFDIRRPWAFLDSRSDLPPGSQSGGRRGMQKLGSSLLLSASDLVGHLHCRRLTALNLEAANGRLGKPKFWDPFQEILQERGRRHEEGMSSV